MKSSLPTLDLLEQTHTFPCPYAFKIIGKADAGFSARVVTIVREELRIEVDPPHHVRGSVGGRHLAVTLEPIVGSASSKALC